MFFVAVVLLLVEQASSSAYFKNESCLSVRLETLDLTKVGVVCVCFVDLAKHF